MNRKILILGIVLIILIGLAYVYQGPLKKWQNNLGKPKNILARIDTAKIDKIEVASGNNTVVLTRPGGSWTDSVQVKWKYNQTKDFYVAPSIMDKVLAELNKAAGSEIELVSNNRQRKSEFKTDSAGLAVQVYQAGAKVADFIIGNPGNDYNNSYISAPESANTYSVKADLSDAFDPGEWRDLTVFSSAKEKINKIRFQYPNREFTVELISGQWSGVLPEKFNVNKEKMEKILEVMSNLKAVEIPEQIFKNTGLEKHLLIIQATGEKVDNILMVGESQDGLYYAKKGDSDNIYLIDYFLLYQEFV